MTGSLVTSSIATALLGSTAVLIASVGELLAEKVGVYNLGIEGMMLLGALAGFAGMSATGNVLVGIAAAVGVGAASAFVFGIAVCVLGAEMIMAGLGLWFIGTGISSQLGTSYARVPAEASIGPMHIPFLSDIPYIGEAIFQLPAVFYIAVLLAVLAHLLLTRTRHGLDMRAVGEDPATADAVGVSVVRWRVFYVVVGGALAGMGGAVITLTTVRTWLPGVTSGQGWIALAVVIFAGWSPLPLIAGALLFGGLGTLGDVAQTQGWPIPSQLLSALPYIGTIVVLIVTAAIRARRGGWPAWPSALGVPFTRGA